jgi:ABC-type multidrug transport system fused ATPase/permease subunit
MQQKISSIFFSAGRAWLLGLGISAALALVAVEMSLAYFLQQSMIHAFSLEKESLVRTLCVLIAIVLTGAALKFGEKYWLGRYGAMTMHEMRVTLAGKTRRIAMRRLEDRHSGDWLSRLTNDGSAVQQFIAGDLYHFVYQPLVFAAAFGYLLYIDWQLVLICSVIIPVSVVLSLNLGRPLKELGLRSQEELSRYNALVQETMDGSVVIKSNNMQTYMENRVGAVMREWLGHAIGLERRRMLIVPVEVVLRVLPFVLCILAGGYRTIKQQMTPDELLVFIYLINFVVQPAVMMPHLIARYRQTGASMDRMAELLREPEERTDGEAGTRDGHPLTLERLGFSYDGETEALRDFSHTFESGKLYAVVGESGSGKSTLFKLLTGLYEYDRGAALLFGKPLNALSTEDIRGSFSVVPQDTYLFPASIGDNILIARPGASPEEVREAARRANAHDFIMQLPDGYNTLVSDGGSSLSGGQRQRIALARAILKDAPIFLLDEAASALDNESEMKLYRTLAELAAAGKTVIIIAHRLKVCEMADEVIVMKQGRKLAAGPHRELLAAVAEYARMHGLREADASSATGPADAGRDER